MFLVSSVKPRQLGRFGQQVVILFPLALLGAAVVGDLVDIGTHTGAFAVAADRLMLAGLVSGVLAAPFGLVDWRHLGPPGSQRLAALHGTGNLLVLMLFAAAWVLRPADGDLPPAALALELTGAMVAIVTACLGAMLVSRLAEGDAPGQPDSKAGPRAAKAH
jgi:uncharacterized membrane protein